MSDEIILPEGWKIKTLKEICFIVTDGTHKTPTYVENGVPFISIANIQPYKKISFERYKKFITQTEHIQLSKRAKPEKDDILFPRIGTLGFAKRIDWDYEVSIFVGLGLAKPNCQKVLPKFLEYYMNTSFVDQYSRSFANGSGRLTLPLEASRAMPVPLPSLNEQQFIVEKIEELFSEIDKGVENLKTAQQQLKVYRQSVLKWAFEGRLTNKNVKDGELPEKWRLVDVESLLSKINKGMTTGPFGTALKKHEHKLDGVPVLGIENIGEGMFKMPNKIFVSKEKAEALQSFKVHENDIIISRSGTVGEICAVPNFMDGAIISTNLIRVSIDRTAIDPKYFVYMFQGGDVRSQVKDLCKGSSRVFLNQTILKSINFPVCAVVEQGQVVKEIESRLSICDKLDETISNGLQQSEALKQSVLKKAFEGKLVAAEQELVEA